MKLPSNDYESYWKSHKKEERVNLPRVDIVSRMDLFRGLLRNKTVLHIGCADYPFTEEKIKNRQLLHYLFLDICKGVYGCDIDCDAISLMTHHKIPDLFNVSIYELSHSPFKEKRLDYIIISEVIEHLVNPGQALAEVRRFILESNPECKVIFTVPNIHNFLAQPILGILNSEIVHHDHKFYFSYRTFRTLLEQCGFKIIDFHPCIYTERSNRFFGLPLKTMSIISPSLAPHLFFVANPVLKLV